MILPHGALGAKESGKARLLAGGLFILLLFAARLSFAETAVIPMQYRSAVEALPMVQAFLSPQGRAVADPRTNALLVEDEADSLARIRDFLAAYDRPGRQGRIKVRFHESAQSEERSAAAGARATGEGWSVSVGEPRGREGADIRYEGERRDGRRISEFSILAVSGSPAFIMVGEDLLFTERWVELTRRYARVTERVSIQRVQTGFEVRPTFLTGHADIEIIPRLSERGSGGGVIRFIEAATRLAAPYGQWVSIGAASGQSNEVMAEILAWGRGKGRAVASISVMVESSD